MSVYRIDFFKIEAGITTEHIKTGFDDLQQAVNAASEGRRDGYKTHLLKRVGTFYRTDGTNEDLYNPVCELV